MRSIRIAGIGGRHDDGPRLFRRVAHRPQQIERRGHRELRGAETGDEVAATHASGVLHGLQHLVDALRIRRRLPSPRPSRA